jgi:hypothetical protein
MAEGWIDPVLFGEGNPEWIPRVLVRRQGTTPPLDTTFVSVIEPYERKPNLRVIERLPLSASDGAMLPPSSVGIQLNRGEGRNDIFLMADRDYTNELAMPEIGFRFRGELALLTLGPAGLERAALCNAETLEAGLIKVQIKPGTEFVEIVFEVTGPRVVAGPADALEPPQ